jgi:surface protein
MSFMFSNSRFNQPINTQSGSWVVSAVTDMSSMFFNTTSATSFNQNIGNWDVSKVTNFNSMFSNALRFNNGGSPSISGWTINTTSGVTMSGMFATANQFNQPIGSWNVSKVTNMAQMFYICPLFNQPLSTWERVSPDFSTLANVTSMAGMFLGNINFNQPIGNWNVSNVITFESMFRGNPIFNQDIGNWNISGSTNFNLFMDGKTPLTFSATNLDSIYNGWSTKTPKTGITINFGSANYTISGGQAGKDILTGSTMSGGYGWTIIDGGGI